MSEECLSREQLEQLITHVAGREPAIQCESFLPLVDALEKTGVTHETWAKSAENVAANLAYFSPGYDKLARRLLLDEAMEHVPATFSEYVALIDNMPLAHAPGLTYSLTTHEFKEAVRNYRLAVDKCAVKERDYADGTYMGAVTLVKKFFRRDQHGKIIESLSYMQMRVALAAFHDDLPRALEFYEMLMQGMGIAATPSNLNGGTDGNWSSCFIVSIAEDAMSSISQDGMAKLSMLSKSGGGLGIDMRALRPAGSTIRGTGGISNGIVPLVHVIGKISKYVDQGGGKRPGAFTLYFCPTNPDTDECIKQCTEGVAIEDRTAMLFFGILMPDVIKHRIMDGLDMTQFNPDAVTKILMNPEIVPGFVPPPCVAEMREAVSLGDFPINLHMFHGKDFTAVYEALEKVDPKFTGGKTVNALKWWKTIQGYRVETGRPFVLMIDYIRATSNQTYGSFSGVNCNLCTETYLTSGRMSNQMIDVLEKLLKDEVTAQGHPLHIESKLRNKVAYDIEADPTLVGVCNLANLALPRFVENGEFDFGLFEKAVEMFIRFLDRVVDITNVPLPQARWSNLIFRAIGLGTQGFADVLSIMHIDWESREAENLVASIWESLMYMSVMTSNQIAVERGSPYPMFEGSPMSKGKFQHDLHEAYNGVGMPEWYTPRYDWELAREKVLESGVAHSDFTMQPPTATTGQLLGNSEAAGPRFSNVYIRQTNAGDLITFNKYLVRDLTEAGLWCKELADAIRDNNGSLKGIPGIPPRIAHLHRTAFEISQRAIMRLAAIRARFLSMGEANNLFFEDAAEARLNAADRELFLNNLGVYYQRFIPAMISLSTSSAATPPVIADRVAGVSFTMSPDPLDEGSSPGPPPAACPFNPTGAPQCDGCG